MKNIVQYEWENFINNKTPKKNIEEWDSNFGPKIISRNIEDKSCVVEFSIYLDNPNLEIYLVGDFNKWEDDLSELETYKLKIDDNGFGRIRISNISHKDKYKFLVIEDFDLKYFCDPASVYFDDLGNSIFWDYEDSSTYKQKYDLIDTINRSTKILQTDLPGLISNFKSTKNGKLGSEIEEKETFNFICESGVIDEIKKLGFNTIQFLPFAQSIDGNNWKLRYLVPYQFAIQKNWGSPDDFSKMIDAFHEAGICVIGDFVIGHILGNLQILIHSDSIPFGSLINKYAHTLKTTPFIMLDQQKHQMECLQEVLDLPPQEEWILM